jgi:hypothetical protein
MNQILIDHATGQIELLMEHTNYGFEYISMRNL